MLQANEWQPRPTNLYSLVAVISRRLTSGLHRQRPLYRMVSERLAIVRLGPLISGGLCVVSANRCCLLRVTSTEMDS